MNGVEIRQAAEGAPIVLRGYPSVTETPYDVGGRFVETVKSGAFRRSLSEKPDCVLLLGHEGLALASTLSVEGAKPTLLLSEDSTGLLAEAELSPDDPQAQELRAKARVAPLEMSMGFRATRQKWDADYENRDVIEASLHRGDVSIVGRAASPATQGLVDVRGRGSLEQRKRVAELLGQRIVGPGYAFSIDAPGLIVRAEKTVILPRSSIAEDELEIARAVAGAA